MLSSQKKYLVTLYLIISGNPTDKEIAAKSVSFSNTASIKSLCLLTNSTAY